MMPRSARHSLIFIALLLFCICSGARKLGPPSSAGRALLQSPQSRRAAIPLPVCEVNIGYSVTSVNEDTFNSYVTITNNREVSASLWQLVYRYADFSRIGLDAVEGAAVLSMGSPNGAPVRLVNTMTNSSGIPEEGGKFSFNVTSELISPPAYGNETLNIQRVNFNGLQCSLIVRNSWSAQSMLYDQCQNSLSFFSTFGIGSNSADNECQSHFCCGSVLRDPSIPPPPPPPSPPPPSPPPPSPPPPSPPPPRPPPPSPVAAVEVVSPQPESELADNNDEKASPETGAVVAGVVAAIVAALICIAVAWLLWRRRWRKQQALDPPSSPFSPGAGGNYTPTADKNTLSLRHATTGSVISLHASTAPAGSMGGPPLTNIQVDSAAAQEVFLGEQLGAGAFGVVYKGTWNEQSVAVKVLQTACTPNSKELASFRQESALLSSLRHPHIIALLAACTIPPNICIVEELAEGGSLYDKLHGTSENRRRRPLPYGEIIRLALEISDAMAYLHLEAKIVHRDLKPQNVLLDASGRAKVCDFGIAKFKDRTFLSTINGQAGTPAYMAPELFDGGSISEKVDVFSFGVLLWEMLTGEIPWSTVPSPMQIIYYIGVLGQRLPIPMASPPELRRIIEACWHESPGSRPAFPEIQAWLRAEMATIEATPALAAKKLPSGHTADEQQSSEESEEYSSQESPGAIVDGYGRRGGGISVLKNSPLFLSHTLESFEALSDDTSNQ